MVVTNEIENYITLSEEQRKNVCKELARLVFELEKDKSVECIYFAPYKNLGDIESNVLDITVVRSIFTEDEDIKEFKKYNYIHQQEKMVKKYGVEIYVHSISSQNYSMLCFELFQSTILFVRGRKYNKIIEQMNQEEEMISYYSNLAQIEPPLLDGFETKEHQREKILKRLKKIPHILQDITNMY